MIPTGSYRDPYLEWGFQMQINTCFLESCKGARALIPLSVPLQKLTKAFDHIPICGVEGSSSQVRQRTLVCALLAVTRLR